MKENPLVSIVIPTYKRPDTLTRAIGSVLNQTYPNCEVIVVDDNNPGSEGRLLTEEKMKVYEGNDRVKYVKHPYNKNGSAARNTGAAASDAEYVGFLDDDDEFLPTKIESQLRRLSELDSSYGCCYSKSAFKKPGEKLVEVKETREGNLYVEALCCELYIMAGSNLLVKKEAFNSVGGFDESFKRYQDVEFLTKLLQKYKMAYDDKLGLIVNIHDHKDVDCQKMLDQYEEAFSGMLVSMDDDVKKRFYYHINVQRFWDFLRTKHDLKSGLKMIREGKVGFFDACKYSFVKTFEYFKRKIL